MAVLPPELRPASIDEKLARGLVRQEMRERGFAGLDPVIRAGIQAVLDTLITTLQTKGRLGMPAAAALMRDLEARIRAEPRLLRVERRSSGKTLSRQRMHEEIAVAAYRRLTGGDDFGGTSMHVLARPHEVFVSVRSMPFTFIPHMAERFLNRKGEAWEAAGGIVAQGLTDALPLFALLARPASRLAERRLALPLGEGLALGTVEEARHWDYSVRADASDRTEVGTFLPRFLISPDDASLGRNKALMYRGMTYIAPGMLRPEQVRLREALLGLTARLAPMAGPLMRLTVWPHALGRECLDAASDPVARAHHDLSVEAAGLLCEGWAVRAMGGSAPAPGGPLAPDTPIAHQARAAQEEALDRVRGRMASVGFLP